MCIRDRIWRDDAVDEIRLHDDAVVRDARRDHRHLQGRGSHVELADRRDRNLSVVTGNRRDTLCDVEGNREILLKAEGLSLIHI